MALKHAQSGEVIDLRPLGDKLQERKTYALVKTDEFEAVRLIIAKGDEIPSHKVTGQITLLCLEGQVSIEVPDSTISLSKDDWVYLEGSELHSVRAHEDSALLLTIMLK
ncbi:MAG: cupin [Hyphomicrobiaceae bacterium]|nr:cupin [Hyphomicrobiaceae bacterium]